VFILSNLETIRNQIAAAISALPHDHDEACLRLAAATAECERLIAEARAEMQGMDEWLDGLEAQEAADRYATEAAA
jgi:hypothetical protein